MKASELKDKANRILDTYYIPEVKLCLNCNNSGYHQIDGIYCKYIGGHGIKGTHSCGEWEAKKKN